MAALDKWLLEGFLYHFQLLTRRLHTVERHLEVLMILFIEYDTL